MNSLNGALLPVSIGAGAVPALSAQYLAKAALMPVGDLWMLS